MSIGLRVIERIDTVHTQSAFNLFYSIALTQYVR